jgi:hypothetical protein
MRYRVPYPYPYPYPISLSVSTIALKTHSDTGDQPATSGVTEMLDCGRSNLATTALNRQLVYGRWEWKRKSGKDPAEAITPVVVQGDSRK